jgi:hypothetical protein
VHQTVSELLAARWLCARGTGAAGHSALARRWLAQELAQRAGELVEARELRELAELRLEERSSELGNKLEVMEALVRRLGVLLDAKQVGWRWMGRGGRWRRLTWDCCCND